MKIFILTFLLSPFFAFTQINKELEFEIKKYDSLSLIGDPRIIDNFDEFVLLRDKVEKSIFSKTNKSDLISFFRQEIPLTFRKLIIQKLFEENDTATVVQLFKATIGRKDIIAESHSIRNFDPEIGSIIYNGELFERLIMDPKTYEIRESALKDELLNFIFASEPLNENLLSNIQYAVPLKKEYYDAIKKLVKEKNFPYLLRYIAKFKKQEDVEFIKSFGDKSFFAIQEFPDEKFIPFLEQFIEKFAGDEDFFVYQTYLRTVAKFCSPNAKILVEKIFSSGNPSRSFLISALSRSTYDFKNEVFVDHYCELYYPYIKEAWVNDGVLDNYVFENYTKKILNKNDLASYLYNGFKKIKINEFSTRDIDNEEVELPNLYQANIKFLKTLNNPMYQEIVNKYILELDFLQHLDFFIKFLDDRQAILNAKDAIKLRIDKEENSNYLIYTAQTLKKNDYKELFDYTVEAIKRLKPKVMKGDHDYSKEQIKIFEKQFYLSL